MISRLWDNQPSTPESHELLKEEAVRPIELHPVVAAILGQLRAEREALDGAADQPRRHHKRGLRTGSRRDPGSLQRESST